ncbi:hypothetical protein RQP46_006277 [Phenoliferia psychrophenolica]
MADRKMTIINKCTYTVWPASAASIGTAPTQDTGWEQKAGATVSFTLPEQWNGRLWGRTNCDFSGTDATLP